MRHLLLALACSLAITAAAQPTWRFPISFQDGTGTRDTIWMVYDTSATVGTGFTPMVDTALGEGHVDMDLNVFNVWTPNWNDDSTKTEAWPYTQFPFHQVIVEAFNYVLPVTIKWDLSLGAAPFLPPGGPINAGMIYNAYFEYFNNCGGPPYCDVFDISLDDSVVVSNTPYPGMLFPFSFTIGHHSGVGITDLRWDSAPFSVWPDPASSSIQLRSMDQQLTVQIYDPLGRLILGPVNCLASDPLDISSLPNGNYFLRATTPTNHLYHAKFIKQD